MNKNKDIPQVAILISTSTGLGTGIDLGDPVLCSSNRAVARLPESRKPKSLEELPKGWRGHGPAGCTCVGQSH